MKKVRLGELFRTNPGGWSALFMLASLFAGILLGITVQYREFMAAEGLVNSLFSSYPVGWMLMGITVPPFGYIFAGIIMAVCLYESFSLLREGGVLASILIFGAGALLLSWMWLASVALLAIGGYVGIKAYRKMPEPEQVGEIPFVREFPKPKS